MSDRGCVFCTVARAGHVQLVELYVGRPVCARTVTEHNMELSELSSTQPSAQQGRILVNAQGIPLKINLQAVELEGRPKLVRLLKVCQLYSGYPAFSIPSIPSRAQVHSS